MHRVAQLFQQVGHPGPAVNISIKLTLLNLRWISHPNAYGFMATSRGEIWVISTTTQFSPGEVAFHPITGRNSGRTRTLLLSDKSLGYCRTDPPGRNPGRSPALPIRVLIPNDGRRPDGVI